jgi:hypothetical protein
MPDIARIGSTLMKGLDGQTITARTSGERHAVESQFMDNRSALLAHEIVLEVDPARIAAHAGTHEVVAHRHHAGTDAETPTNV